MNELEKVEKLRERANVSYEEARDALNQCNGDLLDAMVMLEREGKAKAPQQSTYSTNYTEQTKYVSVMDKVEESRNTGRTTGEKLKRFLAKLWKKGNDNFFCVERDGKNLFKIPAWVFVVLLVFCWEVVIPVMIIALFLRIKYSFVGKDQLYTVNSVFDKASEFADQVKHEFSDEE